jgi:hypothetical protein
MENKLTITGLEANYLLYALDAYSGVDASGKLRDVRHFGYDLKDLQNLRDRLFMVHEHPKDEEDEDEDKGSSVLIDKVEAAELALVIRHFAPTYTAIASTLEDMAKGEHEVLCLQML